MAGPFGQDGSTFNAFLLRTASAVNVDDALCARNFLLDEGVLTERHDSYQHLGAVAADHTVKQWRERHRDYLGSRVQLNRTSGVVAPYLDPGDPLSCPETFRHVPPDSPFLLTDANSHLVRLERVSFIRDRGNQDRTQAEIYDLAARVVDEQWADSESRRELDDILSVWFDHLKEWPTFAGYWDELQGVFGPTPAEDPDGWADTLRDRLGLVHHQPDTTLVPAEPVAIIVFKYPVSLVRRLPGNRQALMPPTVLDGALSHAFCPAPRNTKTGWTVSLDEKGPPLHCEVVHPIVPLRAEHVWRVGRIRRPVGVDALVAARRHHLDEARKVAKRPGYARDTDG